MEYDVFLDDERSGVLSEAEYQEIRRYVRTSPRVWCNFVYTIIEGAIALSIEFARILAFAGGLLIFIAALFSPFIYEMIYDKSGEGITEFVSWVASFVALCASIAFILYSIIRFTGNRSEGVFQSEFNFQVREKMGAEHNDQTVVLIRRFAA